MLTGATGNTGEKVLAGLRGAFPEVPVLALARPESATSALEARGTEVWKGDLTSASALAGVFRPGDVLVETANLRLARAALPVFERAGGRRAFCVTTTAVFSTFQKFRELYEQVEAEMKSSPVEVTILRPSMIYGNERDHNMHRLLRLLDRAPAIPVFGGSALMQPVHVEDLAAGIVQAVRADARGAFNLAGPTALPYLNVLREAAGALGRRVAM
ncbi:MAG TPA: NAD-dependent epimerase/dehydratase family protein, partial [Deinococcales bacterium]|nr:NAD-dependent epimerase/dehydratase family protein [Deinococcales bacterium]